MLLLAARLEVDFEVGVGFEESSVYFEDDLRQRQLVHPSEIQVTYPVLDIAGPTTASPRRLARLGGAGG